MTAKVYLSQLYTIEKYRHALQLRIDELTVKAGYGTGREYARNFSGHRDLHCPMETAILNQWMKEDELEELLAKFDEKKLEIMRVINDVPDERLRTILIMRHVEFMPWKRIQSKLGYKHIQRLFEKHGNALALVKVPRNTIYCISA